MSRVIQVRDVPDDVHAELTRRAAAEGMSLSRWSARELAAAAGRARNARLLGEAPGRRPPSLTSEDVVDAVRADRADRS